MPPSNSDAGSDHDYSDGNVGREHSGGLDTRHRTVDPSVGYYFTVLYYPHPHHSHFIYEDEYTAALVGYRLWRMFYRRNFDEPIDDCKVSTWRAGI